MGKICPVRVAPQGRSAGHPRRAEARHTEGARLRGEQVHQVGADGRVDLGVTRPGALTAARRRPGAGGGGRGGRRGLDLTRQAADLGVPDGQRGQGDLEGHGGVLVVDDREVLAVDRGPGEHRGLPAATTAPGQHRDERVARGVGGGDGNDGGHMPLPQVGVVEVIVSYSYSPGR